MMAVFSPNCWGQVAAGRLAIGRQDIQQRMKESFRLSVARHRASEKIQLNTAIGEIDRVCELDKKQQSKLKIAAKGALRKSVRSFAEGSIERFRGARGFNDLDLDELLKEIDNKNEGQQGVMEVALAGAFGLGSEQSEILNNKFWVKAVEKTLNEDQRKKLNKARMESAAFRRSAAVNAQVARIDQTLRLSKSQRVQLVKLLDSHMGEVLQKNGLDLQIRFVPRPGGEIPVPRKLVESVLTKDQMTGWMNQVEPQLQRLKSRVNGGAPGRVVRGMQMAAPAVMAVPIGRPAARPKREVRKDN